ncbi:MAG: bifunctional 4-hydroxy-2-oxoglutarate aldolase/2-dehydro-3-deoxy-phosphogluconate aldolase [Chitinophagaceae bacterium]
MSQQKIIIQQLKQQRLMPLFYHRDPHVCLGVVEALYKAGIRCIEFTNRGEAAMDNFKVLIAARKESMPDLFLAVGTIRTVDQAKDFMDAGADFLISPVFDAAICKLAQSRNIWWIPGCMTPTEIHVAEHAGCNFVKLFPGNLLGPAFVSGIKVLFPHVSFMPTGGVEPNRENLQAWFDAGVSAVGMGSTLITKKLIEENNFNAIEKNTRKVLENIKALIQKA